MCGIAGVMGSPLATFEALQALMVLQHRGQDAAGILTYDPIQSRFHHHRGHGLIQDALPSENLQAFAGSISIGHTRYATTATKNDFSLRNLQPQFINFPDGIALAHNGNLVNAAELKTWLAIECRRHLTSDNDIEVLLNLIAEQMVRDQGTTDPMTKLSRAVRFTMEKAQGGYAVLGVWGGQGMFAFRDVQGLRPLVLGKRENADGTQWMVASETTALRFLEFTPIRDVNPGELLLLAPGKEPQSVQVMEPKKAHCFFEWIYFSSTESVASEMSVYRTRLRLGEKLAAKARVLIDEGRISPDVVIPVPDTSRPAAIALAENLGIPYRELLIKNRYIQRSFILPTQSKREKAVQMKLTTVSEEIKGKKVLLVDDSIVRGTTSKRLIKILKEAGAAEVYLASTCPPIKNPCYFGIDFPQSNELIAAVHTKSELETYLDAEAVIYQELEDLEAAMEGTPICQGCLTGKYPFDVSLASATFIQQRQESERGTNADHSNGL